MKTNKPISVVVLFLILILTGYLLLQKEENLPSTSVKCPLIGEWQGIIPGKSNQRDVISKLGIPYSRGFRIYDEQIYFFYSYRIPNGIIQKYVMDKVFFNLRGTVIWMEIGMADRDRKIHEVSEVSRLIGNELDTVYINNNFNPADYSPNYVRDVLGGPDQVYVWANCGTVLLAIPSYHGDQQMIVTNEKTITKKDLTTSQPPIYHLGGIELNGDAFLVIKFLFPPTSYDGFKNKFLHKIPYYGWGYWENMVTEYNSNK